jgi:hypothetical protein
MGLFYKFSLKLKLKVYPNWKEIFGKGVKIRIFAGINRTKEGRGPFSPLEYRKNRVLFMRDYMVFYSGVALKLV